MVAMIRVVARTSPSDGCADLTVSCPSRRWLPSGSVKTVERIEWQVDTRLNVLVALIACTRAGAFTFEVVAGARASQIQHFTVAPRLAIRGVELPLDGICLQT